MLNFQDVIVSSIFLVQQHSGLSLTEIVSVMQIFMQQNLKFSRCQEWIPARLKKLLRRSPLHFWMRKFFDIKVQTMQKEL